MSTDRNARRWLLRLVVAVVAAATLHLAAQALSFEPDLTAVSLLTVGAVLVGWALIDLDVATRPEWHLSPQEHVVPPGEDPTTASWSRLIEGHLTARSGDESLRDRLGRLTDQRLRRRGLDRQSDQGRELMGPVLADVLCGPVRRLKPDEIDACVERIERL